MAKAAATAAKKAPSKSEVLNNLATATELSKKQVTAVLEALASEIKKSMSNRGAGVFTIPGLIKITKRRFRLGPPRRTCRTPSSRVRPWIGPPRPPIRRSWFGLSRA